MIRFLKLNITVTKLAVFVLLPIRICLRVINFFLWIFTFFGCCGLCCRSKPKKEPATPAPTTTNGKSDKTNGPAKDVTIEELTSLLEKAKGENKLQALAKQLVDGAKSGKAMTGPP